MQEGLAESSYDDFALSIYDPFQGNVCVASNFIGLPVVATPAGPTGSDLSIILVGHKPTEQPPFTLIRPKSTLQSLLSPILQIAAPPLSFKDKADGACYVFVPRPSPSEEAIPLSVLTPFFVSCMNRANFDPNKRGCDNRGSTIGSSIVSCKDATRVYSDSRDHVEQTNQLSGSHNSCRHFALYPKYICTRGRSRASRDLDKTEFGQLHITTLSKINRRCSNHQET